MLVLFVFVPLLSACTTLHWYGQAARGQLDLISQRQDIEAVIANPATAAALRDQLRLVLEVRAFASQELGLPDNASYTRYVELDRDALLWNVIAAPEFSLQPVTWCYPLVGCLAYRGWFRQEHAQKEADRLAADGLDTRVAPVAAYSTLGRLEDPVTSAMLRWDDATLAGLIFHELAHQQVFVAGETMFNEAYATSVERAGVAQWLQQRGDAEAIRQWQQRLDSHRQFIDMLLQARARLQQIYAIELGPDIWTQAKQTGFGQLRHIYREWVRVNESDPYAAFFDRPLNNADLVLLATYEAGVHAFDALLAEYDHDLSDFYSAVADLAKASPEQRAEFLGSL